MQCYADCADFPCEDINQELIDSHPDNPKYAYRHEIPENMKKFKSLELEDYLAYQEQKWTYTVYGDRVTFYEDECQQRGYKTLE